MPDEAARARAAARAEAHAVIGPLLARETAQARRRDPVAYRAATDLHDLWRWICAEIHGRHPR